MAPVELVAAVRDEHQRAQPGQPPRDVVQELAGGRVGPVNVLDDEKQAVLLCRNREHGDDRLEQTQLRLLRVAEWRQLATIAELREELRKIPAGGAQSRRDGLAVLAVEIVPERLDEPQGWQREARPPPRFPQKPA